MKKYTSLSTYLFLLLLLNRSVLAIHTENALTALTFNHHNGVWMNKGIIYSRCTSAQFDRLTCANFSLIHSLVTKSQVIRPDCSFLVHRISCALHKLNCPSYPESSFQMYDIPCQSSCHATIDICAMQVARSQQHYSSRNWQTHPKRSASVFHPSTSPTYMRPAPSLWQPQLHRIPPSASQSVWPWRPFIPSTSTVSTQRRIPRTSLDFADGSDSIWKLQHADCRLLPSGGCDDWARRLVKHHSYYDKDYTSKIRQNPACPQNYQESCGKIFPMHFTKIDWIKGNFTVALVMRVSQTFWWFGKFDRFQPFFRFNVKLTLKSDIMEYNDKIILTNTWPSTCVCPDKLVVGKRYLLLTHSNVSRQTLRITTESVFLEKPKKYTKLILCWMGKCPRQSLKGRKRIQNGWNWRWQTRRLQ